MNSLSTIIPKFLEQHQVDRTSTFLIACSGGVDSMVLASLFLEAGLKPALAHCNFMLRGNDANEDQKLVESFAAKNDLPFFTTNFETSRHAEENGISIQMAARELRYAYFERLILENDFAYLCTAHHADDSLETILLNLGRGSGLAGLSGIKSERKNILRPLLNFSKNDLLKIADDLRVEWREDISNNKTDYQRNFLRHKVIPAFKENFPGFDTSFQKTQEQLQHDGKLFLHLLNEKLKSLVVNDNGQQKMSIKKLLEIPGYTSLLHHWLQPFGKWDLTAIIDCIDGQSGRVFASNGFQLLRDRESLILRKSCNGDSLSYPVDKNASHIDQPFEMEFGEMPQSEFQIEGGENCAAFDREKLQFPLTIRKWKHGDTFVPLGMKGRKKLSDFFIDKKLNLYQKEDIWVMLSGEDIIWIINHRMDDRYKISQTTKSVYFARLK